MTTYDFHKSIHLLSDHITDTSLHCKRSVTNPFQIILLTEKKKKERKKKAIH
jgi:hypothetical protein